MKKKIIALLLTIWVLSIALGVILSRTEPSFSDSKEAGDYQAPTLFVHGYGGGYGSEKNMIEALSEKSGFRQVLRININRKGDLSSTGRWQPDVEHPLIAVVFNDGKPNEKYLRRVLVQLKSRYKIKAFNAVGHSAGANAWVNLAVSADKQKMPGLQALITIAGPFNGFMGMPSETDVKKIELDKDGKPNTMVASYSYLDVNKDKFPKNTRVLNLFGNIGDDTDGVVPVSSARSLRYIVEENAKSYTEQEVTNAKAQHSALHDNNQVVNQFIYDFLK